MNPNDPLLDQIERIRRQQTGREYDAAKAKSESRVERMKEDLSASHRFFLQLAVAATWVWVHIGRPIKNGLTWMFGKLFRQYRKLWSLVVYRRDEFNNLRLSKRRAGLFLTGTLVSLFFLYEIVGFVYDASMYAATAHVNETMYLTNSQEIDAQGNVHAVKGCDALPCSDTDSVYFRLTPSAFNHVWSLFHSHMLFFPDYVSAAVPPGLNKCTITSYGVRAKFLMRGFDVYPELLRASCIPVERLKEAEPGSPNAVPAPPAHG